MKSGKEERSFAWDAELNYMTGVCISPNGKWLGRRLATTTRSRSGTWRPARKRLTLEDTSATPVPSVSAPTASRLASGGNGSVKVWDAITGKEPVPQWTQGLGRLHLFQPGRPMDREWRGGWTILLWDSGPR